MQKMIPKWNDGTMQNSNPRIQQRYHNRIRTRQMCGYTNETRKIDLIELDSSEESNDDSWNGIFQTDIDNQVSNKRRRKEIPTRITKAMNKMTAQKERVLDELSKIEKLHQQQELF